MQISALNAIILKIIARIVKEIDYIHHNVYVKTVIMMIFYLKIVFNVSQLANYVIKPDVLNAKQIVLNLTMPIKIVFVLLELLIGLNLHIIALVKF